MTMPFSLQYLGCLAGLPSEFQVLLPKLDENLPCLVTPLHFLKMLCLVGDVLYV